MSSRSEYVETSLPVKSDTKTSLPVAFVPTPTNGYRVNRKMLKALKEPGFPVQATAAPRPAPAPTGARMLIWKQDPSVAEIGVRKTFVPLPVAAGPRDARIESKGLTPVYANAFGDFIQTPGTDEFDTVHTYAVVRQTLTMVQRAVSSTGNPVPWQWNSPLNGAALQVFAHGLPNTMNAFYSRQQKALKFGDFIMPGSNPPKRVYTCQSFDIVAHETGHAILDGLKPGWLTLGNPPQTGGLHESFGDLTAIFLALSQLDQVEAVIAQTKANLHNKTFLADLAEEFGLALGRPNGLRNADNDLTLSQTGNEVHAISQVFTGAIYDILSDIFAYERKPARLDDAQVLLSVAQYLYGLVIRAFMAAPSSAATYADVVNRMLSICASDGKPVSYRNYIRNHFSVREVVVATTPLNRNIGEDTVLVAGITDAPGASQDRSTCCGTMKLSENDDAQDVIDAEVAEFTDALKHFASDQSANVTSSSNGHESRTRATRRRR